MHRSLGVGDVEERCHVALRTQRAAYGARSGNDRHRGVGSSGTQGPRNNGEGEDQRTHVSRLLSTFPPFLSAAALFNCTRCAAAADRQTKQTAQRLEIRNHKAVVYVYL
jgi:hypothetical protein